MAALTLKERRQVTKILNDVRAYRHSLQENQIDFWSRFAVTQNAGSRYERAMRAGGIPHALRVLIGLYALGFVTDDECRELSTLLIPVKPPKVVERKSVQPPLRKSVRARVAERK